MRRALLFADKKRGYFVVKLTMTVHRRGLSDIRLCGRLGLWIYESKRCFELLVDDVEMAVESSSSAWG